MTEAISLSNNDNPIKINQAIDMPKPMIYADTSRIRIFHFHNINWISYHTIEWPGTLKVDLCIGVKCANSTRWPETLKVDWTMQPLTLLLWTLSLPWTLATLNPKLSTSYIYRRSSQHHLHQRNKWFLCLGNLTDHASKEQMVLVPW
jgi:hypothetical protein